LANQEHLDILKQGVEVWNIWRQQNLGVHPDLSFANLRGKYLNEANLREANLSRADLSETFLHGADLREADLRETRFHNDTMPMGLLTGTSFIKAKLSRANLYGANLTNVNLIGADLSEANLNNALLPKEIISETILTGAFLREVDLSGVDLSKKDLSKVDLSGANLKQTNLTNTILQGATLTNANLNGALLLQTNLEHANLNGCSVYGISVWDVHLEGASQSSLIISDENEPTTTVDDLEIAQFIYLLLNHKKLRNAIIAVTERGVLLLGRFSDGGLKLLQAIAVKLREENYLPIIFDFDRPDNRDFTETIMTLAGLSRFVIVDLSGPSVPNELRATIPHFKIPFVPIIEEGRKVYSMFPDLLGYPWVLPPVEFSSKEQLIEFLAVRVIEPAEVKSRERQALLHQLFDR